MIDLPSLPDPDLSYLIEPLPIRAYGIAQPAPSVNAPSPSSHTTTLRLSPTDPDTQYSIALPANVEGIVIHNLSGASVRFSFATGNVADPTTNSAKRFEVTGGATKDLGLLDQQSETLYYASSVPGALFELAITMM